ncbi:MAG: phosphoglycolate phosphatase [Granulosicoccus sp.]|nr:phosphoglycolate phosphatase [Granulosicoccus sp.]
MTVTTPLLILFDLDGTLVDSVPDLAASVTRTLEKMGRDPHPESSIRNWVGNGVDRLIKRALTHSMDAEPDESEFELALSLFMDDYRENVCVDSKLCASVAETLPLLISHGHALGCVTNKASDFTIPLLEKLDIHQYFSVVVSGNDVAEKKPSPLSIEYAAKKMKMEMTDVIMVGDSINDIQAAKNAGVTCVGVPDGYNHGVPIADANPDYLVETIADIPHTIAQMQSENDQNGFANIASG